MLKMTLRFVRLLSKSKTIGIILVIAVFPLLVNQAFADTFGFTTEMIVSPDAETTPPTVRAESFFDSIRSFFSGLFGFLFGVQNAYATMNVTERMEDYEMTQINSTTWIHRFGLPNYIANPSGDFVPYLFTEDANKIELESGIGTFHYDKSTCKMALYNSGLMTPTPVIADDNWVIRIAQNGTDNWSDVPENSLPCIVTTDFQTDSAIINSTKSNVNATISEVYHFDVNIGLKHDLYFTNNNPDWNDHKFSWSNVMLDVPNSFAIARLSDDCFEGMCSLTTDMYSMYSGANQPFQLGGNATLLDQIVGETISYNSTDFIETDDSNVTTQRVFGFTLYPQQSQPILDFVTYAFKDAIDQLSLVQFIANTDQTLDVRVDYANITQPLGIGQTVFLDPIVTFGSFADRVWSGAFGSTCGATSSVASEATTLGVASGGHSGASAFCSGTYVIYDISSIPDNATPTRLTYQINVTSGSVSMTSPFFSVATVFEILFEDISSLSLVDFASTFGRGGVSVIDPVAITGFGGCPNPCSGFPFLRTATLTLPTLKALIDFEDQLESGRNFYQLAICPDVFSGGCSFDGAVISNSNTIFWDRFVGSFFEVEFQVFTVPDEPTLLTANFSPSPDTCLVDWEPPLNDGGKAVSGYKIERNINGGSFTTLVADTGFPIPTDFTDSTIVANESYFYRVSAINSEGIGTPADTPQSCGIPDIPDAPTLVNVFEDPISDLTIKWVLNFDGALPITGYKIERSVSSGVFQVLVGTTGNTNTEFIDGTASVLLLNTYRVSAINSLGTSPPSNEFSNTPPPTPSGGGGEVGSPVASPVDEDLLTQEEFDLALAQAIAQIPLQQVTVFEQIVSTFFEFAIVDVTHENLVLNSFLDSQRLGIRWSSGQDIVVVSATPSTSPFFITFEQLPAVKQGSRAVISTDFLLYNLQVPRNACTDVIRENCVEKLRYEIPVVVNAIINGTNVSDTGTITVDLVDELLDPILLLLLATFGIPVIGVFVQRSKKRAVIQSIRRSV